jgi:hypothetical protein
VDASEVLTIDEINARFAPELSAHPTRDEVYQKALELRPTKSAFRFLGTIPEDTVFVV